MTGYNEFVTLCVNRTSRIVSFIAQKELFSQLQFTQQDHKLNPTIQINIPSVTCLLLCVEHILPIHFCCSPLTPCSAAPQQMISAVEFGTKSCMEELAFLGARAPGVDQYSQFEVTLN